MADPCSFECWRLSDRRLHSTLVRLPPEPSAAPEGRTSKSRRGCRGRGNSTRIELGPDDDFVALFQFTFVDLCVDAIAQSQPQDHRPEHFLRILDPYGHALAAATAIR